MCHILFWEITLQYFFYLFVQVHVYLQRYIHMKLCFFNKIIILTIQTII